MIVANPGAGPVSGSTRENADKNMRKFLEDCGADSFEFGGMEHDGRFGYQMKVGDRTVDVDMPGLPLEKVRFVSDPGQNIWDFPRLYIDGSSWVWKYAVSVTKDKEE